MIDKYKQALHDKDALIEALSRGAHVDPDFPEQLVLWINLPDHFTDQLRDQGICCDDYDYCLMVDPEILWTSDEGTLYGPNLLFGCCENTWLKAILDGVEHGIGMAYHS